MIKSFCRAFQFVYLKVHFDIILLETLLSQIILFLPVWLQRLASQYPTGARTIVAFRCKTDDRLQCNAEQYRTTQNKACIMQTLHLTVLPEIIWCKVTSCQLISTVAISQCFHLLLKVRLKLQVNCWADCTKRFPPSLYKV